MLNIIYGDFNAENYIYSPDRYFDSLFEEEWLEDELVKEMVKDVDKSEIIGPHLIQSPVLGPIPPAYLSGGVKGLILMYHMSDKIINATACGDNCAKWILKIAEKRELVVRLSYPMDFGESGFDIRVLNTGEIVHNRFDLGIVAFNRYNIPVKFEGGVLVEGGDSVDD